MARINLLPWREERRRQLTQEFARQAVLACVLAAMVGAYAWYHVGNLVDSQQARNNFLETEIAILRGQIREIEDIEDTRDQLLSRMSIIQDLQQRRPQVVHLFHQVASTLPDGVYLSELQQNGDQLTLRGRAQSNARVSNYMRNLDASEWLTRPRLEVVEIDRNDRVNAFTMHLSQATPEPPDEEDN